MVFCLCGVGYGHFGSERCCILTAECRCVCPVLCCVSVGWCLPVAARTRTRAPISPAPHTSARAHMERESNPMQALCRSGCGFYGNPATDGLCSLCFKEALKKKQQPPVTTPSGSASGQFSPGAASLASLIDTATAQPTVPCSAKEVQAQAQAEADSAGAGNASAAATAANDPQDDGDGKEDQDKDKKKKNRCATCRKKVGLTGFQCRCGGLYCAVHRYSDKHECSFNYREMGAQEIRRNNPVVVGEKIQKI